MKKKLKTKALSILMAVLMVATIIPIGAISSFAVTSGDYDYSVVSETDKIAEIDKYNGTGGDITIPSTIDSYMVANIGYRAFADCTGLTSVIISDGITSIDFGAFQDCTSLTSITIPNSVTSIDIYAFRGCTGLKNIIIPDSVTYIGSSAFEGCTGLTAINVSEGNTVYSSIDGIVYSKDKTELLKCPEGKSGEFIIPDGVTRIDDSAFWGCTGLTNVTIPDSVTSIGWRAFQDCTGLKSITIPDSVTSIGSSAFNNTPFYNSLPDGEVYLSKVLYEYKGTMPADTEINIRFGTVSISDGAFSGCTGLTNVTIPDSVTSISYGAFIGCTGLTNITIPDSVTSIDGRAFQDCTGLKGVIIGKNVTIINDFAFDGCTSLINVTMGDSVTDIGEAAFAGTPFYNSQPDGEVYFGKVLYKYKGTMPENTEIIVAPGTVSITEYAFGGCTGLTNIVIPNTVINMNYEVFSGCEDTLTITGIKGSAAEKYATDNRLNFIDIDAPQEDVILHAENFDYKVISEADKTIEIVKFTGTGTEVLVPDTINGYTISNIATNAFAGCSSDFVIKAPSGSVAEKYAKENNINFVDVTAPTRMLGDVNGDDKVTAADAILALRAEAKLKELSPEEFTAADVTGDGKVTAADAIKILRFEAKLITAF